MPHASVDANSMGAGSFASDTGGARKVGGLGELINQAKKNYLDEDIEQVEGLTFNQYDLFRRVNMYLNSRFENGHVDERGNDKYFHNIINHRCAHATKNIDLDTKDIYIASDDERGYMASFIMRAKLRCWMRDTHFAEKLNRLADKLPKYGAVIWKKTIRGADEKNYPGTVDIEDVDILDVIFDPTVRRIKDSHIFIQRHLLHPEEMRAKVDDGWDADVVEDILQAQQGSIRKSRFMRDEAVADAGAFSLTDSIPTVEVFEMYGWVPETAIPEKFYEEVGIEGNPQKNKYVYVMAIVDAPSGNAGGNVPYLKKMDPEDFPFKDCLLPARNDKRWLPLSISELLLELQVRANELINRFFRALRSGSLHLFQTRSSLAAGNLFQDAEDGDILVTKSEITPVALELRAFNQYQTELQNIEVHADKISNTFEVVTGESLPTNTPFRLGAQLGASANKIYDQIREECGIFLSEVFMEWILPDLIDNLEDDEVLDIIGSVDELKVFDTAYRRSQTLQAVKDYILKSGHLPTQEEIDVLEKTISDSMGQADRKLKLNKEFIEESYRYSIRFDVTGETRNRQAETETLGNMFQIVASNPQVLQDENARMLMARIMEGAGVSPIYFTNLISQPQPSSPPIDAAPPAQREFGGNQDNTGLTPERAVQQAEQIGEQTQA